MVLLAMLGAASIVAAPVPSRPPVATVERLDATTVAGTASDPDTPGKPIALHVYVDGRLFDVAQASPRFEYRHAPFGAGRHKVEVYALGVDTAGALDGQNIRATGPGNDEAGCAPMRDDAPADTWCRFMPSYWQNRQRDTAPLFNQHVWIGVNNSYGGMIAQLYGEDRSVNLLQEHGGSAMQISLWGYDAAAAGAPERFYRKSPPKSPRCDPEPYDTLAACTADGFACGDAEGAPPRPSRGRQITTCGNVCNGWDVAAPFNPLQAQAPHCKWEDRGNDVARAGSFVEDGRPGWAILNTAVSNFTKGKTAVDERGSGTFPGLSIEQRVTLGDVYAKVSYTIRYAANAPLRLGVHPQEMPAIYTGRGIAVRGYRLGEPDRDLCVHGAPGCEGSKPLPKGGGWWGVCDASQAHCLTVATFDSATIARDTLERTASGYATLTPLGEFALVPGLEKRVTLYLFPYRYDRIVDGVSIADRIDALRPR